jgi:hypothetical protein
MQRSTFWFIRDANKARPSARVESLSPNPRMKRTRIRPYPRKLLNLLAKTAFIPNSLCSRYHANTKNARKSWKSRLQRPDTIQVVGNSNPFAPTRKNEQPLGQFDEGLFFI